MANTKRARKLPPEVLAAAPPAEEKTYDMTNFRQYRDRIFNGTMTAIAEVLREAMAVDPSVRSEHLFAWNVAAVAALADINIDMLKQYHANAPMEQYLQLKKVVQDGLENLLPPNGPAEETVDVELAMAAATAVPDGETIH